MSSARSPESGEMPRYEAQEHYGCLLFAVMMKLEHKF
jgi:hypothetical protein